MANGIDLSRLSDSHQRSRQSLEYARAKRRDMIRETAGGNYSEEGSRLPVPLNLMALYQQIVTPNLIDNTPRVMFQTTNSGIKPQVAVLEKDVNREIERQYFSESMQEIVVDAYYGPGIAKVCLMNPGEAALGGYAGAAGQVCVRRVSIDDLAFDSGARDFRECGWIASRQRVPYRAIKENKNIPRGLRKDLKPTDYSSTNEQGDERASMIGRGYFGNDDDYEDMIDLWEFYFPRHRRVQTFVGSDGGWLDIGENTEPLFDQPWIGPLCGPYHFLRFGIVPDNAMPKAPMHDLYQLHLDTNHLLRKLIRQARRQKSNLIARRSNDKDMEVLRTAKDGDALGLSDPTGCVEVSYGGPNQQNAGMMEQLKVYFDFLGGNLSLLGGRAPQSDTATQDKILNQNSGMQIGAMQKTVLVATSKILKAIGWYRWHDPFLTMKASYDVPGMDGVQIDRTPVSPMDRRKGKYEELDLQVDACSMRPQTPESRAAELKQMMLEIILPAMGLLQQQGYGVDMGAFLRKYGQLKNITDLPEIVNLTEPPQPAESGGAPAEDGAGMPAATSRTYNRVSTPQRTEQGDSMNRINAAWGVDTGGSPNRNGKPSLMGA